VANLSTANRLGEILPTGTLGRQMLESVLVGLDRSQLSVMLSPEFWEHREANDERDPACWHAMIAEQVRSMLVDSQMSRAMALATEWPSDWGDVPQQVINATYGG